MAGREAASLLILALVTLVNPAAGRKPWPHEGPGQAVPDRLFRGVSSRIVGGIEAEPHSWPHQVALYFNNTYQCGGSLISNEWVLTAAHCVDSGKPVKVVLGAHNRYQWEPAKVAIRSFAVEIHEEYEESGPKNPPLNDIAVIRLSQMVKFNDHIRPVKLPSTDIPVGAIVTATGWGQMSDDRDSTSPVLLQVEMVVMDNAKCNPVMSKITNVTNIIQESHVCTTSHFYMSPCHGDSGGPLNYEGAVYGIVSFGGESCERGWPAVFVRVHHYLDWIQSKTGVTP